MSKKNESVVKNPVRDLNVALDGTVDGAIHALLLQDVFSKDKNLRDTAMGYTADSLRTDMIEAKRIKEAVHIAIRPQEMTVEQFLKLSDEDKLKHMDGMKGFRRTWNAIEIVQGIEPLEEGWKEFNPFVPVKLVAGLSEQDVMKYKIDHGTTRLPNEWEVVKCLVEMNEKGTAMTNEDKVWHIRDILTAHMSITEREKINDAINEIAEKYRDPKVSLKEQKKICFAKLKGRYQKLQRIAEAKDDRVRQNFRALIYKDPQAMHFTNEEYVELHKLEGEEYDAKVKEIEEKHRREAEKTKSNAWKLRDMEIKVRNWGSPTIQILLYAAYGDEEAQKHVQRAVANILAMEQEKGLSYNGYKPKDKEAETAPVAANA